MMTNAPKQLWKTVKKKDTFDAGCGVRGSTSTAQHATRTKTYGNILDSKYENQRKQKI